MSELFDRLQRLFDEGHGVELPDLRDDAGFAPPEIRPAAVLIAVTDRAEPEILCLFRRQRFRHDHTEHYRSRGQHRPAELL